jgi:hypothetical protein
MYDLGTLYDVNRISINGALDRAARAGLISENELERRPPRG